MSEAEIQSALMSIDMAAKGDPMNCDVQNLTGSFRILRNYCASGRHAQVKVAQYPGILSLTKRIANHLVSTPQSDLCLLICLQFIANFLVDNKLHQCQVWEQFSGVIDCCLRYNEPKIQNCAAMVLYNVLLDNDELMTSITEMLHVVIELTQNEITSEYAVFILELVICKTDYFERHFTSLHCKSRLIVLQVCAQILKSTDTRHLPPGLALSLSKHFVDKSHQVLRSQPTQINSLKASEVALMLDVLNSISAYRDEYLLEIQSNNELIVHVISLLKTIHTISKERGNEFSMLLKISDLEDMERKSNAEAGAAAGPSFGFKAGLVRLVGNMCWHHRGHQDTAREMNAIPLILDCCNIDARNPLIIQWAVLAMRNLCEDNLENQRVVACVDRTGQVDATHLDDLGLYPKNGTQDHNN